MAYEVYIDIKHGDKHAEDLAKLDHCYRFPDGPTPMEHVATALRGAADRFDPNFVCIHCGVRRGDHPQERGEFRCSRYGQRARFGPPRVDAGPMLGYTMPVSAEEVRAGDYLLDQLPEWVDPLRGSRVVRVNPYTPPTEEGEDPLPEMVRVTLAHGKGGPTRRLYRPDDRIRVRRC